MNLLPHHVAATFLTGGLLVGGYCTYQALIPPTLEEHLNSLNVDLISSNWGEKESIYQKAQEQDLIKSIPKAPAQGGNSNFAEKLERWCENKKSKYFLGNEDTTYKLFSLWCTTTKKIKEVLKGRNLLDLDDTKKQEKILAYNKPEATKFIPNKQTIEVADLTKWCTEEQDKDYQYENATLKQVIEFCYK